MASATSPGGAAAVHHVGRELTVERLPVAAESLQVALLADQRPLGGGPHPFPQQIEGNVEEDRRARVPQGDAVRRLQHHAASAGDHGRILHRGVGEGSRLACAERGLPLLFEDGSHAAAGLALDLGIEVDERNAQPARQLLTDHRLAGPGHPHQVDDHASDST